MPDGRSSRSARSSSSGSSPPGRTGLGHRVFGGRAPVAFAQRRSGLRRRDGVRGRRRRRRPCRGNCQVCGAAGALDVPGLLRRSRSLPRPSRLCDGPEPATPGFGGCDRHGLQLRASPRAHQPDELRHGSILQLRAGDRCRLRCRAAFVSPAASALAGSAGAPSPRPDLARSAPPGDRPPAAGGPKPGRAASTAAWKPCRTRPSLCSARSSSRRSPSATTSCNFARSLRCSILARSWTRRSPPWRKATAPWRRHGLPASTHRLASPPGAEPDAVLALRARARILALSEALAEHADYFDTGAAA